MSSTIPTPITVPAPVARLARERGFGAAQDVRFERTTASMVAGGLATFTICMIAFAGMTAFNAAQDTAAVAGHTATTMHLIGPVGLIGLIGLGAAIRGLLIGTRAHFLFPGGLISQRRSAVTALAWSQITALRAVYSTENGRVTGYRPHTDRPGRAVTIPLTLTGDRDRFTDQLLDHGRAHHIPIQ